MANDLPVYTCNPKDFVGIEGYESKPSGALTATHDSPDGSPLMYLHFVGTLASHGNDRTA
jgi:hypothetical protein